MKAVMLSIRPEWCEKIISGKKTVEVRKSRPKLETPFKCYIYCTLSGSNELFKETLGGSIARWNKEKWADKKGKVIGEFVCDEVVYLGNVATDPWERLMGSTHEAHKQIVTKQARLTEEQLHNYGGKFGWHISNLVIYDEPRALSDFRISCKEYDKDYPRCGSCEYYYYESNESVGFYDECMCDGLKHIQRPPQSWCYVEE